MPRLFAEFDLDDRLLEGQQGAAAAVAAIPEDQFLASSDDEIVEYIKQQGWILRPLSLDESAARMSTREINLDVSGDLNRYVSDRGVPLFIPGTEVTITTPYVGTAWLWEGRTNPSMTMYPEGTIIGDEYSGSVVTQIVLPHDVAPNRFKQQHEESIELIRMYIQYANAQVTAHNQRVHDAIRSAIAARRERLGKHAGIAALLNIPLQERTGAPPIQRIPLKLRRPPPLPVPPRNGLQPEPGIADADYEKILNVIRHEGRTFETTPRTFAKLDEEELRDIILAHLNGHFEGAAAGEAFRRAGKTDIRIEDKERSAFIAECKIWSGQAEISEAIEQLLSYLTWRDSKAALVVFNKSIAGFSELPERMRQAIAAHRLFLAKLDVDQVGEYRFLMRSAEDEGRRVTVHAFIFNLYFSQRGLPKARGGSDLTLQSWGRRMRSKRQVPSF